MATAWPAFASASAPHLGHASWIPSRSSPTASHRALWTRYEGPRGTVNLRPPLPPRLGSRRAVIELAPEQSPPGAGLTIPFRPSLPWAPRVEVQPWGCQQSPLRDGPCTRRLWARERHQWPGTGHLGDRILGTASGAHATLAQRPRISLPCGNCSAGRSPSLALAPPPQSAFSPFPPPASRCLSGAPSLVPRSRVRDGGSSGHHLLLTIGIASGAQPCDLGYPVDWRACPWPGSCEILFLAPTVPSLFCPTKYSRLPF